METGTHQQRVTKHFYYNGVYMNRSELTGVGMDLQEWDACDGCEAICLHSMVCGDHTAAANDSI